jgi:hypothetical protein
MEGLENFFADILSACPWRATIELWLKFEAAAEPWRQVAGISTCNFQLNLTSPLYWRSFLRMPLRW